MRGANILHGVNQCALQLGLPCTMYTHVNGYVSCYYCNSYTTDPPFEKTTGPGVHCHVLTLYSIITPFDAFEISCI